jgi:type I restriction enzyme S subunit
MKLQPYPAYKRSGVHWLGEIPTHWNLSPGRAAFREKKVKNIGMIESQVLSLSYGRIVIKPQEKLHGLVPESFETYQVVDPGDIIVRSTDLQNDWNSLRIGLVRDPGIITSAYLCLNVNCTLLPEYAHLILHTYDLKKIYYGMGSGLRQNLDFTDFKYLPILVPPLLEQQAIGRFLDYVDSLINRYIRAKRKLITLLNEQKQAIIHRAVTRGLDPDVPLKPSGIDWLGDIPMHWEEVRLGALAASFQTGPFGTQLHAHEYVRDGVPIINPSHMKNGKIVSDRNVAVGPDKVNELYQHRVRTGDIVLARRGELGRCALVREAEEGWLCGTGSLRVRLRTDLIFPEYLLQLISSKGASDWLSLQSVGSTMDNLNTGILRRLPLPLPPISDQQDVVAHITTQNSVFERSLTQIQDEIDLIREYRARLIADVVTGKFDVRGVKLPAEADDAFDALIDDELNETDELLDESDDELEEDDDAHD